MLPLEEEDLKTFVSKFIPVSLKKGDYFIKDGEISRKIAFIVSSFTI